MYHQVSPQLEALCEHFTLDVRDGLQYVIAKDGINKNNIVIVDHNRNNPETVAVFRRKFLMPVYIGSEKLGEAKFMSNYIKLFNNMFLFENDFLQKRTVEIFTRQFTIMKTRPQGDARKKLIERLHKHKNEVENIDWLISVSLYAYIYINISHPSYLVCFHVSINVL